MHGISCQRSDIIKQIMFFGVDYLVDEVRSRRKLADVGRRTPRWALEQFRERYAANLRRELQRIPFARAIAFNDCHSEPASAGEESASSAGMKQIPRFARNDKGVIGITRGRVTGRVPTRMCSVLSPEQPSGWRSGITNDPNRAEDPQYILRLFGQVITVSLETVKVVGALPPLGLPA